MYHVVESPPPAATVFLLMTALATVLALTSMAIGLSYGSEANVPLGRAVLGGLLARLVTTLFTVPCVYSIVVENKFEEDEEEQGIHKLSMDGRFEQESAAWCMYADWATLRP